MKSQIMWNIKWNAVNIDHCCNAYILDIESFPSKYSIYTSVHSSRIVIASLLSEIEHVLNESISHHTSSFNERHKAFTNFWVHSYWVPHCSIHTNYLFYYWLPNKTRAHVHRSSSIYHPTISILFVVENKNRDLLTSASRSSQFQETILHLNRSACGEWFMNDQRHKVYCRNLTMEHICRYSHLCGMTINLQRLQQNHSSQPPSTHKKHHS